MLFEKRRIGKIERLQIPNALEFTLNLSAGHGKDARTAEHPAFQQPVARLQEQAFPVFRPFIKIADNALSRHAH